MATPTSMAAKIPDMDQRGSHRQTVPIEGELNPAERSAHIEDDLPPPYSEASSSANHQGPPTTSRKPSHAALEPAPWSERPRSRDPQSHRGYVSQRPMSATSNEAKWEEMRDTPGCCFSDSAGCCFSSRGGCCFSDRGGCCFSDREACCFSDRKGCCFSDHEGCCCSGNRGCC
jgi:hypothetical protein